MLHGWNYLNYTKMTKETDAWHNRMNLVNKLSQNFDLIRINFPGFCGEKEPNHSYNLDDYAKLVHQLVKENDIDIVLGYSFGGAVATYYASKYNKNIDLILISPAIARKEHKSKKFMKTPKMFDFMRNKLRNFYTIYITKTNEMKYGTKFLRNTYQNIVRVDLTNELNKLNPERVTIIYGSEDEQVKIVKTNLKTNIIQDGGHDIGNTHTDEIIKIINKSFC